MRPLTATLLPLALLALAACGGGESGDTGSVAPAVDSPSGVAADVTPGESADLETVHFKIDGMG